jgi:hypothetical protein
VDGCLSLPLVLSLSLYSLVSVRGVLTTCGAAGRVTNDPQEILQAAFATGLTNQEIERRLTDTKMGGTIVDRLGVTAPLLSQQPAATTTTPGFSPSPPPASATSPQGLPPRPTTPTSLRMRRRQNVPQPHNL